MYGSLNVVTSHIRHLHLYMDRIIYLGGGMFLCKHAYYTCMCYQIYTRHKLKQQITVLFTWITVFIVTNLNTFRIKRKVDILWRVFFIDFTETIFTCTDKLRDNDQNGVAGSTELVKWIQNLLSFVLGAKLV